LPAEYALGGILPAGEQLPISARAVPACTWQDAALCVQEIQAADAVWQSNVDRRDGLVHPSPAYSGVWLRDSFWTLAGLGDLALSNRALGHFAATQLPSGQIPTQFTTFLRDPVYRPDESTLLFLIWAAWQVEAGGPQPKRAVLKAALGYVLGQSSNGLYRGPRGMYTSWLDSFRLPANDTLAYNQGLYAVALQGARRLGLTVKDQEISAAIAGYRSLVGRKGYLRFSAKLNYHDASALTGEFLSLWLLRQPILSDQTVRQTLADLPSSQSGFKILTDAGGRYLPGISFTPTLQPGDYQNGGSWLLYDYLSLAVGALHHIPGMEDRMEQRLRTEFATGAIFHEYLETDPHNPYFPGEPSWRDRFSWDSFVVRVDQVVAGARTG
jgi:hypothetical protein